MIKLVTNTSSAESKIALFRSLFQGREDVYPARFESQKTGRSGYSPACANEWVRGLCEKPRVKCAACPRRKLLPVTDEVIRWHLSGMDERGRPFVMGVYPMLLDETCRFLAVDFDGDEWRSDAQAVLGICNNHSLTGALERSRSGNGGHIWLFFKEATPARLARNLGSFLLTEAMELRPEIGLKSYDRLFPDQDTLPRPRAVKHYPGTGGVRVPMLARMFDRRCKGYEAVGYQIQLPGSAVPGWPAEVPLPIAPEWKRDYAASVRRLIIDGVDVPLADLFLHAAAQIIQTPEGQAHARSATEAFLYRRLQTLTLTRGRFKLNARLPIQFDDRGEMEIDLLDTEARLAVELDGPQHLADPEAYRRDRRKDLLLQESGYLVVRFLTDDVSKRLSDVLDTLTHILVSRATRQ